jgi:hypothetical protein
MNPTASEMELLVQLREVPRFRQTVQELLTSVMPLRNINLVEVATQTGLQKAGCALLQEWAQPISDVKPLPKARRHSKKK